MYSSRTNVQIAGLEYFFIAAQIAQVTLAHLNSIV